MDLHSGLLDDSLSYPPSLPDNIDDLITSPGEFVSLTDLETFTDDNVDTSNQINPVLSCFNAHSLPSEFNQSIENTRHDDELAGKGGISNSAVSPIIRSSGEKSSQSSSIPSNSLVLSSPELGRLKLVCPLENTYRARYKSDYFPQNGKVRRPRYIADDASNHFITIQIPEIYEKDLNHLYIRGALVTKSIEGLGRYYSPYKFQKDHNNAKIPDENPIYTKVDTNREVDFIMKLQLVLIKSKSDHLNYVQPLKPFTDELISTTDVNRGPNLLPKDLISKYQLDQSQIAFTLCTQFPNRPMRIHPETTVYSTIITEASTLKKTTDPTSSSAVESTADIRCPHCDHPIKTETPTESDASTKPRSTNTKASRVRRRRQTATDKNSNKRKKNA